MNTEEMLTQFQKKPDTAFAKNLYRQIDQPLPQPKTGLAGRAGLATAAGVAALGLAVFTVPAVADAAQNFLNLFRVKQITAIAIDPARLEALGKIAENNKIDLKALIGDDVKIIKEPSRPAPAANAEQASKLAGFTVKMLGPSAGMTLDSIQVQGDGTTQIKANSAKLNALLGAMGITDIKAPTKLDGATISVNVPNVVATRYSGNRGAMTVTQAKSPEVSLPDGVSMAELGEIGLRVTGMSPADAKRLAASIDWNSTLVVPIPTNVASFRDISIRGNKGVLITQGGSGATAMRANNAPRSGATVIWSENGIVYAATSAMPADDLVAIAATLQ
ncbi:MAG: hypothetical protein KIH69_014980 [Anaerolineae bacterium]|nr:hypothetical protein [Anaerolineae bacterium]